MKAFPIYSTLAKSAALATLALTALVGAGSALARPHYIQDVQYVQISPQVVISPPQLVITPPQLQVQAPVYVQPSFVPGRIYYINGYPYLNGHPYRGHGKKHKNKHNKHFEHGHEHGKGHGHGHGGHR